MLIQNNTPYQSIPTFGRIAPHSVELVKHIEDLARTSKLDDVVQYKTDFRKLVAEQESKDYVVELVRYFSGDWSGYKIKINGEFVPGCIGRKLKYIDQIVPYYRDAILKYEELQEAQAAMQDYKKVNASLGNPIS